MHLNIQLSLLPIWTLTDVCQHTNKWDCSPKLSGKIKQGGKYKLLKFSNFNNLFDDCSIDDNKRDCSPKLSGKIKQGGKYKLLKFFSFRQFVW